PRGGASPAPVMWACAPCSPGGRPSALLEILTPAGRLEAVTLPADSPSAVCREAIACLGPSAGAVAAGAALSSSSLVPDEPHAARPSAKTAVMPTVLRKKASS